MLKRFLALVCVTLLLTACAKTRYNYEGAPPVPHDVPPPTNLFSK